MVIIFALFLIPFVYAGTVRITSPIAQPSFNINSTCNVNVNNSIYWNGHSFVYGSVADIESDPLWDSWVVDGGVCTEGDKCGYFSTCEQLTDPIDEGCGVALNSTFSNFYSNANTLNFLNETTINNSTIVRNNTSPTFINLIVSTLNFNNLLSIDVGNRLLYDLASVLSIDFNDRKLYASDGTDVILDWYNVGLADFDNSNITTTGIISASYIRLNELNGACDLTINHSWCSNSTGSYFVG